MPKGNPGKRLPDKAGQDESENPCKHGELLQTRSRSGKVVTQQLSRQNKSPGNQTKTKATVQR